MDILNNSSPETIIFFYHGLIFEMMIGLVEKLDGLEILTVTVTIFAIGCFLLKCRCTLKAPLIKYCASECKN